MAWDGRVGAGDPDGGVGAGAVPVRHEDGEALFLPALRRASVQPAAPESEALGREPAVRALSQLRGAADVGLRWGQLGGGGAGLSCAGKARGELASLALRRICSHSTWKPKR